MSCLCVPFEYRVSIAAGNPAGGVWSGAALMTNSQVLGRSLSPSPGSSDSCNISCVSFFLSFLLLIFSTSGTNPECISHRHRQGLSFVMLEHLAGVHPSKPTFHVSDLLYQRRFVPLHTYLKVYQRLEVCLRFWHVHPNNSLTIPVI